MAELRAGSTVGGKPIADTDQLNLKLDASSYTATDVRDKLKTVDGSGSGIDADLVDGWHRDSIRDWNNLLNKPSSFPPSSHTHTKSQITDFPSSLPANGGNSDTVDGKHASDFLQLAGGVATTTSDYNSTSVISRTGFYMGSGTANKPPSSHSWTWVLSVTHNTSWIWQIGKGFNPDDPMYYRTKSNGVWSSWKQVGGGTSTESLIYSNIL